MPAEYVLVIWLAAPFAPNLPSNEGVPTQVPFSTLEAFQEAQAQLARRKAKGRAAFITECLRTGNF